MQDFIAALRVMGEDGSNRRRRGTECGFVDLRHERSFCELQSKCRAAGLRQHVSARPDGSAGGCCRLCADIAGDLWQVVGYIHFCPNALPDSPV
eukprot:2045458-Rhodomonas_salina.1